MPRGRLWGLHRGRKVRVKLVLVQPQLVHAADDRNIDTLARLLAPLAGTVDQDDIVLLPEHWDTRPSRERYVNDVRELAGTLGCHVIGGSHHETRDDGRRVNSGVAVAPDGQVVGRYEKLRPYAGERALTEPGDLLGEFEIGGRRVLVLICADFWFSDLIHAVKTLPDLVLVPALSVTRKPTPDYSRSLWRDLAVARAYEFGVYVGVSDWGHPSELGPLFTSAVGGFADPTQIEPARLFTPVAGESRVFDLDFGLLESFRTDRRERGFYWR